MMVWDHQKSFHETSYNWHIWAEIYKIFSVLKPIGTVFEIKFIVIRKLELAMTQVDFSHKVVSFDQFPIKSGILPVSSMSEAHLITIQEFL